MPETVRRELTLPVDPETAWSLVSEPEHLREWFAEEVSIDLRPGGGALFRWDDGTERRAVVEEVDAPHHLAFRWESGDSHDLSLGRVDLTVEPVPGGSRIRVAETLQWSTATPVVAMLGAHLGWGSALDDLRAQAEPEGVLALAGVGLAAPAGRASGDPRALAPVA